MNFVPPIRPVLAFHNSVPQTTLSSSQYVIRSSSPSNLSSANEETAVFDPGCVSFLLKKATGVQPGSTAGIRTVAAVLYI